MKRSAEERDELNRQFKKAMQQKMTELLPDNVQERLPSIIDQLFYYILTKEYQQIASILTTSPEFLADPRWVYSIYLAMKGMEQYLNVDTEMFFQKYRIWIIHLRALNDFNYQKLVDTLKNDFGIQKYSPKWLFWSALFLSRAQTGRIERYVNVKWFFEHVNTQDICMIDYNPMSRKVVINVLYREPEFDIDNQLTIPDLEGVRSAMRSTREISFTSAFNPVGTNTSDAYYVIGIIYQMFRLGYKLDIVKIGHSSAQRYDIRCSICNVEPAKFTCKECPTITKLCGKCAENH